MPNRSNLDITLHDHGDGAITNLEALPTYYSMGELEMPPEVREYQSLEDLHKKVSVWYSNPQIDIVRKFGLITNILQSAESLFLFGYQYTKTRADQGMRYCEMRFAPQYHTRGKPVKGKNGEITFTGEGALSIKEIVAAVIEGIKAAEEEFPSIEVNLILCVDRAVDPETAVNLIRAFADCDRDYVVGVDLACDEASHPPLKHRAMYDAARHMEFKTTCHAGEWVVNRAPDQYNTAQKIRANFLEDLGALMQNVRDAVWQLHVNRVGHAIPLGHYLAILQQTGRVGSDRLYNDLREYEIGIEGCPASNVWCGHITGPTSLNIRALMNLNLLYSLNQDDDLFMPGLEETFEICDKEYQFTPGEIAKLRTNAWNSRFGRRKYKEMPNIIAA